MTESLELARRLGAALGAALGDGYAVDRTLGEGGFAVVFLVRDLTLKRNLAVKVLSPDMITSKSVLERFRREAETVAQLSHPNIVPLHFIGQQDDLLYLAMQCVDGGSIADRIKRDGAVPVSDAVRITSEVASALAHAHKRGVIHRDIKPANVLVDAESGRCLVTDFGIARTEDTAGLTATGMMLGTPAYLSPEQVTGEPMDHRVDIFALGVMAYEMIAGRVPFDGATPRAAMMKRLGGPPEPLSTLRPDVPPEVAEAIAGCLATNPDDRFQSAADVVRALGGDMVSSGGRSTRSMKMQARSTDRRRAMGIGAAAVVIVGSVLWWGVNGRTRRPDTAPLGPVPPSMVAIPSGDYVIGTDSAPATLRNVVGPRHSVKLPAFAIERTEVTVAAYQEFMAKTQTPAPWTGATPVGTLPVTRVSFGDAQNYCAWKYADRGRLPTEFEWEAAARGVEGRNYPYGTHANVAAANVDAARRGPVPVGSFPRGATPTGLQDMSGNVWEWTSSAYAAYPGAAALPDSMAAYRVIRGGAYNTDKLLATGWMRGYVRADSAPDELANTGFRCALSPR